MPNVVLDRTFHNFLNSYSMIFGKRDSSSESEEQWKSKKCLRTMRHSFHRALTTCRAPLPPGKKYVAVQFLTKELIFFVVDTKGKGQEIFEEACKHLGILDAELFGLAFYQDGEYIFIDLNLKISKYAIRSWKTHSSGIGGDGQPLLILHMKIKYYVDCHLLISEKVVRHHYYLQLRENIRNYKQAISEEKAFLLAAFALQADFGNYDADKHKEKYFEIAHYFPSWIVCKIGEDFIIRNVPALHKDNAGLSRGEAQVMYIKEASEDVAPHNLHFYKMRRKNGKTFTTVWLGIRDSGVHIYEQETENSKILLSTFLWCDIAKLHFEKKKFEILSEGSPDYRRFTYYVQNEELAKNLLWMCRTTHHFHMSNQNKVTDLKKLELDGGKKPYREAYIYTDKVDQAWEKKQNSSSNKTKSTENCSININGSTEKAKTEKKKPLVKMSSMPWDDLGGSSEGRNEGQYIPQHHSMEVLPLTNGCKFSSDVKFKSQSISCFSDRSLTPCPVDVNSSNQLWSPAPGSSISTTPTSTLMSRSSCTSNTGSTCSSLSLTSGSTIKVGSDFTSTTSTSRGSNDGNHWVKCDSFEELPVKNSSPPVQSLKKMCISTFVDKHVRTASVYNAVTTDNVKKHRVPKSLHHNGLEPSNPLTRLKPSLATSTLEINTNKIVDVKRTPSLDIYKTNPNISYDPSVFISNRLASPKYTNSKCSIAQKPNRQYVSNAQNHISSHGRTATRIGVSSLSRDQRLPLTLFNEQRITAAGSEPNLYYQLRDNSRTVVSSAQLNNLPPDTRWHAQNSRSEMNLNVLGQNVLYLQSLLNGRTQLPMNHEHYDSRLRQLSLPDVCNDALEVGSVDFPFIPPPPAYRNDTECVMSPKSGIHVERSPSCLVDNAKKEALLLAALQPHCNRNSESHPELRSTLSSPPDVLDIQELRQRSRDLDLPLITALCNDRSLLMLPKTVPTCSRQRHIGNKDPMRFNRAASLPNGDNADLPINAGYMNGGRPMSWHVDSVHVPHWSDHAKLSSSSWDNSIKARVPICPPAPSVPQNVTSPMLPPTILTSFGKTPERQLKIGREYSCATDNYRLNGNQMLPMKLLACSLGNVPNGRLYHKGSSS